MADFYDVHRKQMDAAFSERRVGEIWNVHVVGPFLPVAKVDSLLSIPTISTTVSFKIVRGHKLVPLTARDSATIAEWNMRHRDEPGSAFTLPDFMLHPE